MKTLLIKGNLLTDKLTIVNGGGVKCLYTTLEEVPSDAITLTGDVEIGGELVIDFDLLVTGEIVTREG